MTERERERERDIHLKDIIITSEGELLARYNKSNIGIVGNCAVHL